MRDKRPVDELSIEELERILAIRKREARQSQMERMKREGRVVVDARPASMPAPPAQSAATPQLTPEPAVPSPSPATPIPVVTPAPMPAANTTELRFDDEDSPQQAARPRDKRKERRWMDRVLLVVEVAAVLAIALIGVNLLGAIGTLEQESEEVARLADEQARAVIPTLAPTPTIRWENIVLPTGHIVEDDGSIIEFNLNEIPSHLRAVVQTQILQPVLARPEPTQETALRIVIPKLEIDAVIVPGVDPEALRLGVGQLLNDVTPNSDEGNLVLAAHNDIYGEIFRYLDQLEPGDRFTIYTQIQPHEYVVASTEFVQPNDVWVMEDQPGRTLATLISCYPYQVNNQRIVVFADRIS
jgi:sortase A